MCAEDKEIKKALDVDKGEKVLASCKTMKNNRFGIKKERIIMVSTLKIYNIAPCYAVNSM